jgi:hypothetical protein
MKKYLLAASVAFGALLAAHPASASSTFGYTCSNTSFQWSASGQATIASTCLQANGMPHATSLVLMGISNQNGIDVTGPNVTLSAYCRTSSGSSNSTSLPLNNIGNNNGNLVQQ